MQAALRFGSTGHGAFLFFHSSRPFVASIAAAKVKTSILCSEIQMRPGMFPAKPAITAPRPKLTSNAGRAQQINVPIEPNKVR